MVFLTLTSKFNKAACPFVLRHGLSLRYALGRGVVRDNPMLDAFLFLPFCQKIVSLELRDDIAKLNKKASRFDQWIEDLFDRIFGKDEQVDSTRKDPLSILESTLRPVLVPNEKWSDVNSWMFHARFVSWARNEYLHAMYSSQLHEAFIKFPTLRRGPQISPVLRDQKLRRVRKGDDKRTLIYRIQNLPTANTIIKAFKMDGWNGQKDREATWLQMERLVKQLDGQLVSAPGTSRRVALIEPGKDLSALSLEDILELAGGQVANCNAFNLLCEHYKFPQLLTKEYVVGLAGYLKKRAVGSSIMVIHIGEAELLNNLISDELHSRNKIAWNSATLSVDHPEEICAAIDCLAQGHDQIFVICNSMPPGQDFSKAFRESRVHEYILIGEADDVSFGNSWETWGNEVNEEQSKLRPPFEVGGYQRKDIHELDEYQFSISDCKISANSSTVSFRRKMTASNSEPRS
mmetsp:Transcript_27878/g.41145  ORF Transcript_27878/g.41145 Transcript_27878/m.41145 type:complete len:461 (+) Transcript_27878:109-1491(+)